VLPITGTLFRIFATSTAKYIAYNAVCMLDCFCEEALIKQKEKKRV
jgi:hypothetical protein